MVGAQYGRDGDLNGCRRTTNERDDEDYTERMYEGRYNSNGERKSSRRTPPERRRYSPSPHDHHRPLQNGDDFQIKGTSSRTNGRDQDPRYGLNDSRDYDRERRKRTPSPRSRGRRGYRDRDHENYRSSSYDSRSRSQSHRRRRSQSSGPRYGGPPSREVILEGLAVDMQEEDVTRELKQAYNVTQLDDVRVIRDKQTRLSRGFGFIRFPSLEASKAFIESNYPSVQLYGSQPQIGNGQAVNVRIAFSRERDDRNRNDRAEGDWTCKICTFINFAGRTKCHRCQTPRMDTTAVTGFSQSKVPVAPSGDSDASPSGPPSQFLLLRGLEPSVGEDVLAKGVTKLYKPSRPKSPPSKSSSKKGNAKVASTTGDANLGAKEGSLRRVLLIRDRVTNDSWRYGFAEFATIDDAQAAVVRFNSFEKFTISSKPVTVDYIHAGVFVPSFNQAQDVDRFCFSPLGNPATRLMYWDENASVSELAVTSGAEQNPNQGRDGRSAADEVAASVQAEGLVDPGKDNDGKAKKRKADTNNTAKPKKSVPAHLQFWSDRHAELHGVKSAHQAEDADTEDRDPTTSRKQSTKDVSPSDSAAQQQSFANQEKMCCYLCSRQFKSGAEVNKHERLSQLHRDNMANADLVSKAKAKMAKAGLSSQVLAMNHTATSGDAAYRDRAKERRAAFGGTAGAKKISLPMKKSAPSTTADENNPDDDTKPASTNSKGASLLNKMGWSAGSGLGARGEGTTQALQTDMYVAGVGLGAEGGKIGDAVTEAERNTKDGSGDGGRAAYAEFAERTREKARGRFQGM